MKKKKIFGRPKLPKGLAKDSTLRVRLSPSEREAVEGAAAKAGQVLSAWARDTLLKAAS